MLSWKEKVLYKQTHVDIGGDHSSKLDVRTPGHDSERNLSFRRRHGYSDWRVALGEPGEFLILERTQAMLDYDSQDCRQISQLGPASFSPRICAHCDSLNVPTFKLLKSAGPMS